MIKLYEFDPYASFVTHDDGLFYKNDAEASHDGWEIDTKPDAIDRLWTLGRRALLELAHLDHSNQIANFPVDFTREEFEKYSSFYEKFSDDLIPVIADRVRRGGLVTLDANDKPISNETALAWASEYSRPSIIRLAFSMTIAGNPDDELLMVYRACFLFACLEEIGNTLVCVALGDSAGICSAVDAADCLAFAQDILGRKNLKEAEKRARAKENARKRHEENYRLQDEAISYYKAHHENFKSVEAAALYISTKIVPAKPRTIVGWIGKWRKEQSAS